MSTVTLYNRGQRHIDVGGKKKFLPGETLAFPEEIGKKIKRLFASEVHDVNDAIKNFESADTFEPADQSLEARLEASQEAQAETLNTDQAKRTQKAGK